MGRLDINHQSRKRIVIVDDSKTMQAVLDQILSLRMGCDVVGIANDAESAVSLVRSLQPDLVTIDLLMPYIDGGKLLEMLADMPDLRKIVISGQINDNLAVATKLRQAGADACIDKREISSNPEEFCKKILTVLGRPSRAGRIATRPAETTVRRGSCVDHYPIPTDEHARLAALRGMNLANDRPDASLDLLTSHMAAISDFPTCLMTFIDRERQWIKSASGFSRGSMPRALAFCNYTLCSDDSFVVPNALSDPRFAQNALVTDSPSIRTYVGQPITTSAGVRLGAICLIDSKPRRVTPAVISSLRSVSQIATHMIENRGGVLAHAA